MERASKHLDKHRVEEICGVSITFVTYSLLTQLRSQLRALLFGAANFVVFTGMDLSTMLLALFQTKKLSPVIFG